MIHRLGSMIGSRGVSTPLGRAVPLPFYDGFLGRLRDAWAVLRGRAFAVRWPVSGELEEALRQ